MANHYLLHESDTNFKYTPEWYENKVQALNIEIDYENYYYEQTCIQEPLEKYHGQ